MRRSVITVACTAALAAAILLPLGLSGMPALDAAPSAQLVGTGEMPGALQGPSSAESESDAVADEHDTADAVAPGVSEGSSSSEPEYVSDVVLVEIADTLTVDEVNAQLPELDFIAVDRIDASDVSYGFVELPLASGVTVDDALDRMAKVEFAVSAQPNYIYHICDESVGGVSGAGTGGADGAGEPSAADAVSAAATGLQAGASSALQGMVAQVSAVNDPKASSQWALDAVKAYGAWDYARGEHTVTVAVLDSGLDMDHPDFVDSGGASTVVGGYSVLQANSGGDTSNYNDDNGHGTHVAGIIAAAANNGTGVAGVSYNANVMPVKVIDSGGNVSSSDAAAGISYAISYAASYPSANVKVINMSFGTGAPYRTTTPADRVLLAAMTRAHDAGILVVCAAGNGGGSYNGGTYSVASSGAYQCFPADFDSESISVINGQKSGSTYARYSGSNYNMATQLPTSTGAFKELTAPGTSILSTTYDGSYGEKLGTSMAAPYVAGVAALVFAANPDKTAKEVKQVLIDTAQDLNASANIAGMGQFDLQTGYGMVDAEAAVKASAAYLSEGDVLVVGGTLQLSVQKGDGLSWTWASSNQSVAAVDTSGKVTGKAAGEATITAKLSNGATLYRTVYVYDAAILGDTTVEYGGLSALKVSDANPSSSWAWSSADTSVASVGASSGQVVARGVGQTAITVHLNGYPDIVGTATVTVTKADLANATLSGVEDQVYAGNAVTLPNLAVYMTDYTQYSFPYYYDTRKLADGTGSASGDYEVSYANNQGKGTATVTVTAKGSSNYKGSQSATFSIGDGNIANATITGTGSYTYTGSPIVVSDLKVVASTGETLEENKDYQVVYSGDHTSAGYASIEVKGIDKYVGSQTKSFYIAPVSIASAGVSVTGVVGKTYTGSAITQSPTLRYNGMTLVEGRDYSISYSSNTNAGTATMRIRGQGNYATYSGWSSVYRYETFAISKRAVTITPNSTSKVYDGTALTAAAAGYTTSGLVKASDLASVTLGGSITNVGSTIASVSGYTFASGMAGNYSVTTRAGTLKVTQASLSSATVALSQTSYTYDGKAKTPAVTVRVGSRTLTQGTDYTVSYSNNVNVGTATVVVTGKDNYTGSASASFSISAAQQPMYRLYNPNSGEHFYTAGSDERDYLVRVGWTYEGIAWYAPSVSATPVYRLYNPNAGDHHYTMGAGERDYLVRVGWTYEGVGWYSDDLQGVPLLRLYNPNASTGTHHYTTGAGERDYLVRVGWTYEGVAWFGIG